MTASVLALWAGYVVARSSGVSGYTQAASGCSCHSSTPNANSPVTVQIQGPQWVRPGSTSDYTITVSGGPATTMGGFNLKVMAGTLLAGANNQALNGELTHVNSSSRSWSFQWQAPAADGPVNIYAIAQAVNNSGNTQGDSWNWYGGVVNTPFTVNVSSLVGVGDEGTGALSLSPARPNPFAGSTRIAFSLAQRGPARLEVFDLGGRRVAVLADGELPAGPHVLGWDGRDERGSPVGSGTYVVRLRTGDRTLSTKVVKVSR